MGDQPGRRAFEMPILEMTKQHDFNCNTGERERDKSCSIRFNSGHAVHNSDISKNICDMMICGGGGTICAK